MISIRLSQACVRACVWATEDSHVNFRHYKYVQLDLGNRGTPNVSHVRDGTQFQGEPINDSSSPEAHQNDTSSARSFGSECAHTLDSNIKATNVSCRVRKCASAFD